MENKRLPLEDNNKYYGIHRCYNSWSIMKLFLKLLLMTILFNNLNPACSVYSCPVIAFPHTNSYVTAVTYRYILPITYDKIHYTLA